MKRHFWNRGGHKRKGLLHIRSKGRSRCGKDWFSKNREQEWIHGVSLCAIVLMLCAAVVGLAAALGRIDISLQIRYLPRGKVQESSSARSRYR